MRLKVKEEREKLKMAFMEYTGMSARAICCSLSSFVAGIREEHGVKERSYASPPTHHTVRPKREQPLLNEHETEDLRKSAKFLDFRPQHDQACVYCHDLINLNIRGQVDRTKVKKTKENHFDIVVMTVDLSEPLMRAYHYLEKWQNDLNENDNEFLFQMDTIFCLRHPNGGNDEKLKFDNDRREFVRIFTARKGMSNSLKHVDYWGTRQQLLSGKVIADHVSPEYGPLDPVFGVLLHPTSGRTGPGDSGWIHNLLFDGEGPIAYHSAVHDAFGYLLETHNVGPGYDYLGSWSVFNSRLPMSGQLSGMKFWDQALQISASCPQKEI